MYPPRFNLVISCTPTSRQSQTRVEFRGAVKEMVFDIPLNPQQQSCMATSMCSEIQNVVYMCLHCNTKI